MKVLIWIMLPWLAASCALPTEPEALQILVSLPEDDPFGAAIIRGVEMALADHGGQAGSHRVEVQIFNTSPPTGTFQEAGELERQAALAAIENPEVVAYLGPASSFQAAISMPLLNEGSMVQISPTATWPGLTRPGFGPGEPARYFPTGRQHFYRVIPTDSIQASAAARWAQRLGVRSVALVSDDHYHGRGASGIFQEAALDLGIEIKEHFFLPHDDPLGVAELTTKILATAPDLTYLSTGSTEGMQELIVELRSRSPETLILGIDSLMLHSLLEAVDPSVIEGLFATGICLPVEHLGTAGALSFLQKYRQLYDQEPTPEAASGYEAMGTLLKAISSTTTGSRGEILLAMEQLEEVSGILGRWHFDEFGDTSLAVVGGFRLRQGRWTFEERLR